MATPLMLQHCLLPVLYFIFLTNLCTISLLTDTLLHMYTGRYTRAPLCMYEPEALAAVHQTQAETVPKRSSQL
jgi:hypothetical protein